jgi:hypothetical protein
MVGLLGLLLAPSLAMLWTICFGLGTGAAIVLGLAFVSLRASTSHHAACASSESNETNLVCVSVEQHQRRLLALCLQRLAICGRWRALSHGHSNVGSSQTTDFRVPTMPVASLAIADVRNLSMAIDNKRLLSGNGGGDHPLQAVGCP